MASKEHCLLCDKPFYGKQKSIRCGVCDSRFHFNCVPNCSPEPSVSATTGKSSYKCANCIKQTGDAANEHSFCISNQKDAITTDLLCSSSCNGDNDSLSVQLETLRTNGICTMEMVQSIVVMLSNLSSEVKQLRIDNEAMKMQLREFQQAPSHVQPTRREAGTSTSLAAKSYRDVVCAVNGNPSVPKVAAPGINSLPEPSVVTGENPSGGDFVTVVKKKRVAPSPVSTVHAVANTSKKPRVAMIGVRSSSSLSVVQKRVRMKSLFVSRFSPDVTSSDVEASLKDQLQLASLACTRLKTKYNSYASFHVSVAEDDFHLINNTGVWPNGCLIAPFYGRLSPEQIYSVEESEISRPCSPGAGNDRPLTPPPMGPVGDSENTVNVVAQGEGASVHS